VCSSDLHAMPAEKMSTLLHQGATTTDNAWRCFLEVFSPKLSKR